MGPCACITVEAPTVGARLRLLRVSKGLRQRQLAKMADVGTETIRRAEAGASTPNRSTLKALASALGVDVAVLAAVGQTPPARAD